MPDHKGFERLGIAPLGIAREPNYQADQSGDFWTSDLCGPRLALLFGHFCWAVDRA